MKNTMKFASSRRITRSLAAAAAVTVGLSLASCSSDDDNKASGQTTTEAPAVQNVALPTAAELNDILNRAVDPAIPAAERVDTVQGGEQAIELFDVMTQSKEETGATFQVLDPVLPGILPDTVNVTVNFLIPDLDPLPMNGVEFIKENDQWKLSREWACTLIENVAPDKVPPVCSADYVAPDEGAPVEAPAEGAPVEAPAEGAPVEAPVEGAPAEGAPVEAPVEVPAA